MAKFPYQKYYILQIAVDIIYNVFVMFSMDNMQYDF